MTASFPSPRAGTANLYEQQHLEEKEQLTRTQSRPASSRALLPPITVAESSTGFRILVPMGEVSLRQVWIFATASTISIEIRSRSSVDHVAPFCKETDDQRIVRELKLPSYITKGSASVRPVGTDLEISCLKDPHQNDRQWAEILRFDTRTSLGSV